MDRIEKDCKLILSMATGAIDAKPPFEWVENAFAPGTLFSEAYEDFALAREHLCERFGMAEDDDDLELIMNGLLKLEEDLGRRMFLYGFRYAEMKEK